LGLKADAEVVALRAQITVLWTSDVLARFAGEERDDFDGGEHFVRRVVGLAAE
jgi:hypothetical protein